MHKPVPFEPQLYDQLHRAVWKVHSYCLSNKAADLGWPRALALPAGEKQLPVDLPEKVNTRESSQIAPLILPQKQHAFSSNLCKTTNSFPFCINEDILLDLLAIKIVAASKGQPKIALHLKRNTEYSGN